MQLEIFCQQGGGSPFPTFSTVQDIIGIENHIIPNPISNAISKHNDLFLIAIFALSGFLQTNYHELIKYNTSKVAFYRKFWGFFWLFSGLTSQHTTKMVALH